MIHHHPDSNMMLEYASGSLSWAHSLVVSAHVQLCPKCAAQMKLLNGIGGTLLAASEPVTAAPAPEDSFARLMARIDEETGTSSAEPKPEEQQNEKRPANAAGTRSRKAKRDPIFAAVPPVVEKLLTTNPVLSWRRLSRGLKEARLTTGQNRHEVAFHRIAPGSKVAEHDHRGKEITMVLYGSFSDADGVYSTGDFLVREPGEVHRPTATQDQECLCLSVVEAPVALTGFWGKVINPFLSVRPS
ncbi:cupin domain-containing protein [Microbulbifer salipaludis]|uniref:Cupin domain-containing protein n=1 Tax=Microbulbifer salipaludis TaxID=187980 RepID=A0ABS3E7S6_9GAMM|nr:ChrR family anti-sigma-E factor [Microbulbifer salipaludis]MBN8431359.1 cupin domain-containing protein [Microbulbifer salipaludis]